MSSNLNSKQLRLHDAHPNLHTYFQTVLSYVHKNFNLFVINQTNYSIIVFLKQDLTVLGGKILGKSPSFNATLAFSLIFILTRNRDLDDFL